MSVVVVGSVNADLVTRLDRRPGPGETVLGSDIQVFPGGKGANQAAASARAGFPTALCCCVGQDEHAQIVEESLMEAGVDLEAMTTVDRPTGVALITVTLDGENAIVVCPGANADLTPAFAAEHRPVWVECDVVVLNLEIPFETVRMVARETRSRLVLNAAPAARLDAGILQRCDPLVVNAHESRAVLGLPGGLAYDEVARRLLRAGARSVVITLGADGALVAEGDDVIAVAAHHVTPVDTTGAGDAFVGALAAELAAGSSLVEAARFAGAMAALSVQAEGAQSSYPDREQVIDLLG